MTDLLKKWWSFQSVWLILSFSVLLTSCGYHLLSPRTLPEGVKKIAVPVFENRTMEANIEVPFTNAVLTEFYKSRYADIVPMRKDSDAVLIGTIVGFSNNQMATPKAAEALNPQISLTREYLVRIDVRVQLVRNSDGKVIFEDTFWDTERYNANPGGLPDITRNEDRQRLAVDVIARDIGEDIHDALTWGF